MAALTSSVLQTAFAEHYQDIKPGGDPLVMTLSFDSMLRADGAYIDAEGKRLLRLRLLELITTAKEYDADKYWCTVVVNDTTADIRVGHTHPPPSYTEAMCNQ
jgi:hypothetical protein